MRPVAAWSSDIRLAAQPVSASRARDFVRLHLGEHLLSDLTDDVVLVVSELVTNALVHAHPPLRVSLQAFDQTLLLEVEDGSQAGPVRVVAKFLDTGGRGIGIVSVLSRDWGVNAHTHGKSVWAEFDLQWRVPAK